MRTVIFLGLVSIADAINPNWYGDSGRVEVFFAITLGVIIVMDITEYLKKIFFNND